MGRLILLALAVLVIAWLVRRALRGHRRANDSPTAAGELVRCARCGLLLPKDDARKSGGRYFCSDEHAAAGPGGT
jgi:uncharacterized protein